MASELSLSTPVFVLDRVERFVPDKPGSTKLDATVVTDATSSQHEALRAPVWGVQLPCRSNVRCDCRWPVTASWRVLGRVLVVLIAPIHSVVTDVPTVPVMQAVKPM